MSILLDTMTAPKIARKMANTFILDALVFQRMTAPASQNRPLTVDDTAYQP